MHLSPNLVLATLVFLPTVAMAVVVTSTSDPTVRAEPAKPLTATANLVNLQGKSIGTATLTQVQDGVNVAIAARSLPKNTTLAWHIHQTGTCDPKGKFASAGSHFNSLEKSHGFEHAEGHHAGVAAPVAVALHGERTHDGAAASAMRGSAAAAVRGHALLWRRPASFS